MDKSICFITALFGNDDKLDVPGRFKRNPEYDYFLFTDINEECLDVDWDVINIKDHPEIIKVSSSVRKSRYPKFMSWKLLESFGKKYDAIFYCDAWLTPDINKNWEEFSDKMKNNDFGFLQAPHHIKSIRNGGILAEMTLIRKAGKDIQHSMVKTRSYLQSYDSSVNLSESQYYANTIFGYDPNNETVRKMLDEFWSMYATEEITHRDQPLWNFLLLKHNVKPINMPTDLFIRNGVYKKRSYMNDIRTQIINILIDKIGAEHYLEIGLGDAYNFNSVSCKNKVSVDPCISDDSRNSNPTFKMTSDEFFAQNNQNFDVIFIDGLHHADQVEKDINNSLRFLKKNGYIVCHDISPTSEAMQIVPQAQKEWTGDCWRAWVKIRSTNPNVYMFVVNADMGCGIIQKGSQSLLRLSMECSELTYEHLNVNRKLWLNLVSIDDF